MCLVSGVINDIGDGGRFVPGSLQTCGKMKWVIKKGKEGCELSSTSSNVDFAMRKHAQPRKGRRLFNY